MPRKPKFRPRITRVKLNPEQAVLLCTCYNIGRRYQYNATNSGNICSVLGAASKYINGGQPWAPGSVSS